MGATLTVNQTTSEMIRLVNGQLVQESAQPNIYVVPPRGEYTFKVTGYALPFQMKKDPKYVKPGEPETQTMTRIEFTITEGKGIGKMFTQMWGFAIGERANLGKFCRAMGVDLTPDDNGAWDLDRLIGYEGKGYVTPSEKLDEAGRPKYANLSLDTVEGTAKPDREYRITITEKAPATNGNGSNGHHAADNDGWPE